MESVARKVSKGRQKIAMEKIKNKKALQVCFSKRRRGIFKKAEELAILCGAQIAVLTVSPGGRPFSFGQPSAKDVIDRFLDLERRQVTIPGGTRLEARLRYLKRNLEARIDGLGLQEMVVLKGEMEELKKAILRKAEELLSAMEAGAGSKPLQ